MATVDGVLAHLINDDGFAALPDFVADGGLDLQFVAGLQAERQFVLEAQVIHLSSVTRAMAANPIPVVLLTTSRMRRHGGNSALLWLYREQNSSRPRCRA